MYEANFFFRAREQNANIYRIVKDGTQSGSIFNHIGVIVYHNQKIKLNDSETLTPDEEIEIQDWLKRYEIRQAQVEKLRAFTLIDDINQMSQWIQSEASDEDIVEVFEELVMSIADLRQSTVRRYSNIVRKISSDRK